MMSAFVHGGACPPHIAIRSWLAGNGAAVFDQYIGHWARSSAFYSDQKKEETK